VPLTDGPTHRQRSVRLPDPSLPAQNQGMEFFPVVDTQRAMRRFRADPVPDDVLRRILSAATRAPSARGAEPWFFIVIRDAETRSAVGRLYQGAWEAGSQFTTTTDADRDVKTRPHYQPMMHAAAELARRFGEVPISSSPRVRSASAPPSPHCSAPLRWSSKRCWVFQPRSRS